jgi:hypothetical protein
MRVNPDSFLSRQEFLENPYEYICVYDKKRSPYELLFMRLVVNEML